MKAITASDAEQSNTSFLQLSAGPTEASLPIVANDGQGTCLLLLLPLLPLPPLLQLGAATRMLLLLLLLLIATTTTTTTACY